MKRIKAMRNDSTRPTDKEITDYLNDLAQAAADETINNPRPMFISELIDLLTRIKDSHGDMGIFIEDGQDITPLGVVTLNKENGRMALHLHWQ